FLDGGCSMRGLTIVLLACVALGRVALLAAEEKKTSASDRAQVMKYLKAHVIGKTVATPKTTTQLDNNRMESDYEDQMTFNNFAETKKGFSFDLVTESKETRYDLDKDGK